MRYFKNSQKTIYAVEPGQEFLICADWLEISESEAVTPPVEAQKLQRAIELRALLQKTDYKDLPSYDRRNTPEWIALMAQRQEWRDEIRQLEGTL